MKLTSFEELFLYVLSDMYVFENQLIKEVPTLIEKTYSDELKETLNKHLEETKDHVKRLDQVFQLIKQQPRQVEWSSDVKNLFTDTSVFLRDNSPSPLLDAVIILIAQRIEHYEIATYGALKEFADVLDYDEAYDILKDSLKEESKADALLTKLAEGSAFKKGINAAASK